MIKIEIKKGDYRLQEEKMEDSDRAKDAGKKEFDYFKMAKGDKRS
jgi:hypothetical protein